MGLLSSLNYNAATYISLGHTLRVIVIINLVCMLYWAYTMKTLGVCPYARLNFFTVFLYCTLTVYATFLQTHVRNGIPIAAYCITTTVHIAFEAHTCICQMTSCGEPAQSACSPSYSFWFASILTTEHDEVFLAVYERSRKEPSMTQTLWAFRAQISLQNLSRVFISMPNAKTLHPLLHTFLHEVNYS